MGKIDEDIEDMDIIEIANALASTPENFKSKEKYLERALSFVDTYDKEDENYARLLNNIGILYFNQKEYKKSLELVNSSLTIQIRLFGRESIELIYSYKILMNIYLKLGEVRNSLVLFDEVQRLNEKEYFHINGHPSFRKIKITNFKILTDIELEFSKYINIIIGENSSGKTSLLQAITLGLLERSYSIGEGNNSYLKYITKEENQAILDLFFKDNTTKVTLNKNRRNVDRYFYPFVLAYGSNIFTNYDNKLSDIVEKLLAKNINDGFVSSIFEEYKSGFYNPKSILNELNDKDTEEAKEIISIFKEIIEKFQDAFKLVLADNNKYVFQDKNNTIFKLEDLSEGYRNNILLVTDIVLKVLGTGKMPKSVKGIILIDEFDKHLHPKWQSSLIATLRIKI